jgi:hypothetical protein
MSDRADRPSKQSPHQQKQQQQQNPKPKHGGGGGPAAAAPSPPPARAAAVAAGGSGRGNTNTNTSLPSPHHLLAFRYDGGGGGGGSDPRRRPPYQQQQHRRGGGGYGGARGSSFSRALQPYDRLKFLQAHYRFLVSDRAEGLSRLSTDADAAVDWEDVAAVEACVAGGAAAMQCPISLDSPPDLPVITPCGHAFGLAALTAHLLAAGGEGMRRAAPCPVCAHLVAARELRRLRLRGVAELKAGDVATWRLLRRPRDGVVPEAVGGMGDASSSSSATASLDPLAALDAKPYAKVAVLRGDGATAAAALWRETAAALAERAEDALHCGGEETQRYELPPLYAALDALALRARRFAERREEAAEATTVPGAPLPPLGASPSSASPGGGGAALSAGARALGAQAAGAAAEAAVRRAFDEAMDAARLARQQRAAQRSADAAFPALAVAKAPVAAPRPAWGKVVTAVAAAPPAARPTPAAAAAVSPPPAAPASQQQQELGFDLAFGGGGGGSGGGKRPQEAAAARAAAAANGGDNGRSSGSSSDDDDDNDAGGDNTTRPAATRAAAPPRPPLRATAAAAALGASPRPASFSSSPATGPQQQQQPASHHYWYQADGARGLVMHPLNTRILLQACGGDPRQLPAVVRAAIVEVEEEPQTEATRRRHKSLAHVPLGAPLRLAEVDMRGGGKEDKEEDQLPPWLRMPADALAPFAEELAARERRRKRRAEAARREARLEAQARARERNARRGPSAAELRAMPALSEASVVDLLPPRAEGDEGTIDPDAAEQLEAVERERQQTPGGVSFAKVARHGFAATGPALGVGGGAASGAAAASAAAFPSLGSAPAAAAPAPAPAAGGAWGRAAAAAGPPSSSAPAAGLAPAAGAAVGAAGAAAATGAARGKQKKLLLFSSTQRGKF